MFDIRQAWNDQLNFEGTKKSENGGTTQLIQLQNATKGGTTICSCASCPRVNLSSQGCMTLNVMFNLCCLFKVKH